MEPNVYILFHNLLLVYILNNFLKRFVNSSSDFKLEYPPSTLFTYYIPISKLLL